MTSGQYSVELKDDTVLIHGSLHISEIMALIKLYRKQGYNYVVSSSESSALCLAKKLTKSSEKTKG